MDDGNLEEILELCGRLFSAGGVGQAVGSCTANDAALLPPHHSSRWRKERDTIKKRIEAEIAKEEWPGEVEFRLLQNGVSQERLDTILKAAK